MSQIFISHSTKDNGSAVALLDWMAAEGWNDVFIDFDARRGIAGGEGWQRALSQGVLRCEVVLCLVSRAWLSSNWCVGEFHLANRLNKRLFGVLIEDIPRSDLPQELTSTWQLISLASGRDHIMLRAKLPDTQDEVDVTFSQEGLTRLRIALERAGLGAVFFPWPPSNDLKRPPYRGLRPLEMEDAGIFFGREANIVEALDRIRGLAHAAAPRLLALLGASGAGKSSFLRAGLLPRLVRDERNYLPLPVTRPERAAINGELGLVRSLEEILAKNDLATPRAEIRKAIEGGAVTLRPLLQRLVAHAQKSNFVDDTITKPPLLVLAIDQGEELFSTENNSENALLLNLVREMLTTDEPALLVIVAIRSDAYEKLQSGKALEGMSQQPLSFPPMPRGSYRDVIEGPPARLKETNRRLVVEPGLTQALLLDIEEGGGRDSLPLLAFTLERLYGEYGARGSLRLDDYNALGRIKGSIEAAIAEAFVAADRDSRIPRDKDARFVLLRRGLIPWLAGIDPDTGSPRRFKARASDIPEEARPLIDLLIAQRLLFTDVSGETGEMTIEPAHESLLRQWGSLRGWLQEDLVALTGIEMISRAARDWTANAKRSEWLSHRAGRLEDAERLLQRSDLSGRLGATDRVYLAKCRERENAERDEKLAALRRRLRLQRLVTMATAASALAFAIIVILVGYASWEISKERDNALVAQSRFLSVSAREAIAFGDAGTATLLAMEALPDTAAVNRPLVPEAELLLSSALQALREQTVLSPVIRATFDHTGGRIATASPDAVVKIWQTDGGKELRSFGLHSSPISRIAFSPDDKRLLVASEDGTAEIIDLETGRSKVIVRSPDRAPIRDALFSMDGTRVFTASDGAVRIWDSDNGKRLAVLDHGANVKVSSIALNPDGRHILTTSANDVRTWDSENGKETGPQLVGQGEVLSAAYSPDGALIVTTSQDHWAGLWDARTGKLIAQLDHTAKVNSAHFNVQGDRIVTASDDKTAQVWDGKSGKRLGFLFRPHDSYVLGAVFSSDSRLVLTTSTDHSARISNSVTGSEIAILSGHGDSVVFGAFSPDGNRVLTVSADGTARIWDAKITGDVLTLEGHRDSVWTFDFNRDDSRELTASDDHTVRMWDSTNFGEQADVFEFGDSVNSAVFSPDGKSFAAGLDDGSAVIVYLGTRRRLKLTGHSARVNCVSFNKDQHYILTASDDRTARLWDVESGKMIQVFEGHTANVNTAVFSHDGGLVLTASDDKTMRIWDSKTGRELKRFEGHQARINQAVFAPDDQAVLSASWDNTARLWDVASGKQIREFRGHRGPVNSASFSPDGKRIVTASWDKSARIWDRGNADPIASIDGHRGRVFYAVFSPDGLRIGTTSEDMTARIWRLKESLPLQEALDLARSRMPRCLSIEQRKEFYLNEPPPRWCKANKWPYLR
jgi:WD40 repeat protein